MWCHFKPSCYVQEIWKENHPWHLTDKQTFADCNWSFRQNCSLSSVGILLEEGCDVYYTKLMLRHREICTKKTETRNNSCVRAVVNTDGTETYIYGLLHKVLVIPGEKCFGIINVCGPSSVKLCTDDVQKQSCISIYWCWIIQGMCFVGGILIIYSETSK